MARQTWLDRTIDATRDAKIVLPWSRTGRRTSSDSKTGKSAS
ncbi:MAG: hypothetical protein AAGF30_03915 [Pseudomonadota bacterium]